MAICKNTHDDPYVPWEWYPMADKAGMRHISDGREMPLDEHASRHLYADMSLNKRQRAALQTLRGAAMAAYSLGRIQPKLQRLHDILVRDGQPISLEDLLDKAADKCRV